MHESGSENFLDVHQAVKGAYHSIRRGELGAHQLGGIEKTMSRGCFVTGSLHGKAITGLSVPKKIGKCYVKETGPSLLQSPRYRGTVSSIRRNVDEESRYFQLLS